MELDFTLLWTWMLLFIRMTGLLTSLPGLGTDQVNESLRLLPALILAACFTLSGAHAALPANYADGAMMVFAEFSLGYIFGAIPALTLSGLAVAGQLIAGSIGLAQANMIDPSLGESISVISRLKTQIATLIFLFLDGHHTVLRAASGIASDIGIGMFRPGMDTAQVFIDRFVNSFELAITVAGPIIVSALLTQFVLGLVTKFVPQVNVFIVSLPLTLLAGLYIVIATVPGLTNHITDDFSRLEETLQRIVRSSDSFEHQ